MKAAVYHGQRDVRFEEVPEPGDPGPGEVRLEVLKAAICGTDASEYAHGPSAIPLERAHPASGHRGPLIMGHEMVGRIEAVGDGVELAIGDRVVPGAGMWCGECSWCLAGRTNLCARYYTIGLQADGGLAEQVVVPAKMCKAVPDGLTDEVAAVAQPLAVALHAIDRGDLQPDQVAVLIGVGGIGNFGLAALARKQPSALVVVDIDDERLERARDMGATHVVNAKSEDTAAVLAALTDGAGADLVVEASGVAPSPGLAARMTRRGGRVVLVGLQAEPVALDLADLVLREIDLTTTVAHVCDTDIPVALDLLGDPKLGPAGIDRVIPLEAVVQDGIEALLGGTVHGKVVVAPS